MSLGRPVWSALRLALSRGLSTEHGDESLRQHLTPMAQAEMRLPVAVGDFTDFFASIFHATNAGRMFRPDNPLMPNYKYVPVAYHSRTSSIRVSGTPFKRPRGQRKGPNEAAPSYGPSRNLDFELELGIYVGTGNELGEPIPVGRAAEHVFGYCLLNDWSARDMQAWEYQPLGPFLGKNFATTVSPWVVTAEALAPFHTAAFARPDGDPAPLPHLDDAGDRAQGGLDITLEAYISTETMRRTGTAPLRVTQTSCALLYWTVAQMIAHHTSNGCNLCDRRSDRVGHRFGPGEIELGQLARTHRARLRADRAAGRREARFHRRRRRDHLPRLLRKARLCPHRLRRMPRGHFAFVILRCPRAARASKDVSRGASAVALRGSLRSHLRVTAPD